MQKTPIWKSFNRSAVSDGNGPRRSRSETQLHTELPPVSCHLCLHSLGSLPFSLSLSLSLSLSFCPALIRSGSATVPTGSDLADQSPSSEPRGEAHSPQTAARESCRSSSSHMLTVRERNRGGRERAEETTQLTLAAPHCPSSRSHSLSAAVCSLCRDHQRHHVRWSQHRGECSDEGGQRRTGVLRWLVQAEQRTAAQCSATASFRCGSLTLLLLSPPLSPLSCHVRATSAASIRP